MSDFEHALATFAEASSRRGLPVWTELHVRDRARHRLYRATGTEAFVLDDKDERRAIGVPDCLRDHAPGLAGGCGTEGRR